MVQLNAGQNKHNRKTIFSFSNPSFSDENESYISKWTIVRQRLPEVLALNPHYRPTSIRARLMLLVAMINKQTDQVRGLNCECLSITEKSPPTTVMINIDGRERYISLKRIPPEQIIHVDMDGLTFSIPIRQLIVAVSLGNAHQTAVKYCPPAVRELLIDLSKTKVINDGRQYRRALYRTRLGQSLYLLLLMLLISMVLALIVSASRTIWKLTSLNASISPTPVSSPTNIVFRDESWHSFDSN